MFLGWIVTKSIKQEQDNIKCCKIIRALILAQQIGMHIQALVETGLSLQTKKEHWAILVTSKKEIL